MIKGCKFLEHDDETKREAGRKVDHLATNEWGEFWREGELIQKLLCIDSERRPSGMCALESYQNSYKE